MKRTVRTVYTVVKIVKRISQWLEEHRISVYASQAAFFIIISSIPMLILVLSLTGLFLPKNTELYDVLLSKLPAELMGFGRRILNEIGDKSSVPILSVSAVTLLWSASRGVRGIGSGIRNVYGGEKDKYYTVYIIKSVLMTLMYIASVLLALVVWVFGDSILLHGKGSEYGILKVINSTALFLLLSAVFMLTYRFFSGRQNNAVKEAPGAFFSAFGWFAFSGVFEFYIENFGKYSYVYGSVATLIVIMLWLYSCMEILLIGAGVNVLMSKKVRFI